MKRKFRAVLIGLFMALAMSDKNKLYFNNTSFTEMKNRGYDPCDRCLGKR